MASSLEKLLGIAKSNRKTSLSKAVKYTKLPPGKAQGSEPEVARPWASKPARPNADAQASRMKSTKVKKPVEKGAYTIDPSIMSKVDSKYGKKPGKDGSKKPSLSDYDKNYKSTSKKKEKWVEHRKGHKNAQGELAEWVIISDKTGKIIASEKSETAANKHIRDIEYFDNKSTQPKFDANETSYPYKKSLAKASSWERSGGPEDAPDYKVPTKDPDSEYDRMKYENPKPYNGHKWKLPKTGSGATCEDCKVKFSTGFKTKCPGKIK